jgi:hypothetical protein
MFSTDQKTFFGDRKCFLPIKKHFLPENILAPEIYCIYIYGNLLKIFSEKIIQIHEEL